MLLFHLNLYAHCNKTFTLCQEDCIWESDHTLEDRTFREQVSSMNPWIVTESESGDKGCSKNEVQFPAYVESDCFLNLWWKSIMYGEPCSTVPVYKGGEIILFLLGTISRIFFLSWTQRLRAKNYPEWISKTICYYSGNLDLLALADKFRTPVYVYDAQVISNQYRRVFECIQRGSSETEIYLQNFVQSGDSKYPPLAPPWIPPQ